MHKIDLQCDGNEKLMRLRVTLTHTSTRTHKIVENKLQCNFFSIIYKQFPIEKKIRSQFMCGVINRVV